MVPAFRFIIVADFSDLYIGRTDGSASIRRPALYRTTSVMVFVVQSFDIGPCEAASITKSIATLQLRPTRLGTLIRLGGCHGQWRSCSRLSVLGLCAIKPLVRVNGGAIAIAAPSLGFQVYVV